MCVFGNRKEGPVPEAVMFRVILLTQEWLIVTQD